MEILKINGNPILPGTASGLAIASTEPLSLWGGYDWQTGEIIDRRHPLSGSNASGKVLAIPYTRGSSTTTAVLLEAIRLGTAPVAILTTGVDSFLALASIVADEMYSKPIPLVALDESDFARVTTGDTIQLDINGIITITRD